MKYFLCLLFSCISTISFSQTDTKKNPIDDILSNGYFTSYSLENFYLHTNKSLYFSEEEINFKAYVVHEESNKPFLETSNLHVQLYDFNNKLVISQLFYVKDGITHGSIKLPKDIKTGNYTIQLNTQWNRNFKEGSLFPIKIYNIYDTEVSSSETSKEEDITAAVKESQNFDNQNTGYILSLSNSSKEGIVSFQLKTDSPTIANEKDKFIYAVLHKKGSPKSVAPIKLLDKINTYNLNFLKETLFNGLNTITVFNKQNKILAQKSYFHKPKKEIDIKASIIKEDSDSISLDLKLLRILKDTNISISVLHEETKVHNSEASITNTLLNADLPETKNAFPYRNLSSKSPLYPNENGLVITGSVNTKIQNTKDYQVILNSYENNLVLTSPLTSDKKFEFKNLLLKHPSIYNLSLTDKKGNVKKGEFYIYNKFITYKVDSILKNYTVKKEIQTTSFTRDSITSISALNNSEMQSYFPINKDAEELDEVILKDVKNKREQRIDEIQEENPYLGISAGFSQNHLIDLEKDGHLSLEDYLRRINGLRVVNDYGVVKVYKQRQTSFSGSSLMTIILDGMPIDQGHGLDIANQNVTNFELITVNISGAGYGVQGTSGVINIITRLGYRKRKNAPKFTKEYETSQGFSLNNNEIKNNSLSFPSLQSEYYFNTVDWIPNFILKPNESNILKIKKPRNESVKLIINGFNNDGDLIHKVIHL